MSTPLSAPGPAAVKVGQASTGPDLIGWIESQPQAAFAAFLALHFAVWTALPTLLYANLPLDLIEALTYGREWQLGYDKLPPLPWWLVEIMHRIFDADAAYYALAQIAVIVAFIAVWATARKLVGVTGALVSVLIIDGMHYFQYTAVKFNHDVIQLPFWALAGYAFHAALKRGRLGHWLLLGFSFGAALWAKYVVWLIQNDFLPLAYAEHRATLVRGWFDHILHPTVFAGSQIFFLLPTFFIASALFWPRRTARAQDAADAFDRRIVTLLAFGSGVAMILLTALSGRGAIAMWGYPLWLYVGLWLVLTARTFLDHNRLTRLVAAWAAVFAIFVIVFAVNYTVLPLIDHRYRAVFFPGNSLAAALTKHFHDATGQKLDYVVGSMWDGGNLAHYSPDQPQVLIDGLPQRTPWIDLNDLHKKGGVVVWIGGDTAHLPAAFAPVAGGAEIGAPFDLPMRRGSGAVHVGWAILKPQ
jgi:hypothetical protein